MTAIINATLVMRDHLIPNGVLLMEEGKIAAFGESRKMEISEDCEIIDAEGKFVGPGFVDAMGKLREAMKDPDCRNLCGIYMEGPLYEPQVRLRQGA